MPVTLSSTVIDEKNALGSTSVFLLALEITIPGTLPIRVVRNTANITWRGQTWQKFPFEIEEISLGDKGEVPQVNLKVSNVSRVMEAYIQEYDTYCKANGYSQITVTIYVLNSLDLANTDPCVQHDFILKQPKTNSQWATFVLSASNPYRRRVPQGRILKNHCRYRFKDRRCQYAGAATQCDHTLTNCRTLANSVNYGGFPAAGTGGLNVA